MKWSEIDTSFQDLKDNLTDVGTRIETAIRNHGQIYHANHKPWYTKRIRIVRQRFLVLKRRLSKFSGFAEIFKMLQSQLKILVDVTNDTSTLSLAYSRADSDVKSLQSEIQRKQQLEFDIFATNRSDISIDRKLCFVMMPLDMAFNPVFKAIRKALKGKGLKCIRSDLVFDTREVILDIWENIRKSRVCIADVSPPRNPNVFYEVGMAHALPKRVILISQKPRFPDEKFPFDVSHVRYIVYKPTNAGYSRLQANISRTLRTLLQ